MRALFRRSHRTQAGKTRVQPPPAERDLAAEQVVLAQQICFTNSFRQPLVVRTSFAVWFLLTAALCCVHAQDQEKKLLDRLLKPDRCAAERCAKQEIYRRRFGVHQQTRKRRNLLRSPETELEKLFRNTRLLHNAILFSDLPRRTHRLRGFVTANTCKFQGYAYANQTARGVRDAPQSGKKVASRAYAQVTGLFVNKAQIRSRSTEKTSRSRSSRCASC